MSDPILPLLVLIVVALLALAVAARCFALGSRTAVGLAGAGVMGLGFLLTLLALIVGQDPGTLALPIGPPGLPIVLSFDPLAAFFLLPVFLTGAASLAFAAEIAEPVPHSSLAGQAACLAGVILAILAADGLTLALALTLAGGAIWASGAPGPERTPQLIATALAALALLGATASAGFGFAAMRDATDPPAIVPALGLIGAGILAGLVPFHGWSLPAHRAAPAPGAALLSGAMQPLALYALVRFALDLGGSAQSGWPLLAVGAASALTGGWRAATAGEVGASLAALTERQVGLAAIGIGLALVGRAADLPEVTRQAAAAALLLAFTHAICGTLGQLAAGAMDAGAGTRRLVALGGMIRAMPTASAGIGATLLGFCALPVGAGFVALWLLFQALLAAPHAPALALVGVVLVVSATLSGVAAVRVFGIACLGRPRGPRTASATDIAKPARPALLALAGVTVAIGLLPGIVGTLAVPAIRQLRGSVPGEGFGLLGFGGDRVLPLVLTGLAIGLMILWLRARFGATGARAGPAWHDGFAAPPAWLPFGDPLTQSAGQGFLPPLPTLPRLPPLPNPRRWVRRVTPMPALLAAMAAFLIALLWSGAA